MAAEEYAYVLDYLPTGKSSAATSEPLAQVIGQDHFTLLEVTPKPELLLQLRKNLCWKRNTRKGRTN